MKSINGTPENDELFAEYSDEILLGLAGDDYLDGVTGTGNNTLSGGSGNDEIVLNQDDTGLGEAGDDVLYSYGNGNNTLSGGSGNDEIFLYQDDTGLGEAGDDVLYSCGNGNNTLSGGSGNDEIFLYQDDIGFGDAGDDILYSYGNGNNTLSGGSGNDWIFSDLHDTVLGDDGNDILYAGRGGSTFTGGAGKDTFWIADVETPAYANIITDFEPDKDTIRVDLDTVNSFTDLQIEQQGNHVIISADYEDLVIVENTEVGSFNANNLVVNENLPNNKGNQVRFATFNAALNRSNAGDLINELSTLDSAQAQVIAEIIQRNNPDVLLLNEFDYDADGDAIANFFKNYLQVSQNGANPVDYPYVYFAPSNTGIDSGFDLDNNGSIGGGNDALGFGNFPGQFGMVLLSKYPIVESEVRTFQNFLWKDMPGALLPDDPNTVEANDWYSAQELEVVRLSSKSHWDIPLNVNGEVVHVLASHPTPPVFDGEEDRNGRRNHDEIRFWSDYVTPGSGEYIYDDHGGTGGLAPGKRFVIMGDQNADPFDGDSTNNAINQLLDNPLINTSVTPDSEGGVDAATRQGGANDTHVGNPAFDTADFADDAPGNLRVDYVLPSQNLDIKDAGVFWPESDDPQFNLVGDFPFPGSDHRLVYTDVEIAGATSTPRNQDRKTVTGVEFLGEVSFPTGYVFEGTEVGGLSGITYDEKNKVYYSLADDRGNRGQNLPDGVLSNEPARFYDLTIDLADGKLDDGDIVFTHVTTLVDENGHPFGAGEIDPEGITLTKDGKLYISSEGDANNLVDPFVNKFSLDGEQLSSLPVPKKFLPTADKSQGIRNNQAFESLTITPDQKFLYTAVENALFQDGPAAGLENQSLARIIKYDLATGQPVEEFVYVIDKVAEAPEPADGFNVNGLVELLAIDNNGTLLALERSFSVGKGNTVKLYEVRTQGALDVSNTDDLFNETDNVPFEIDPAVDKRLLVDFADLGITPDNLEGITLGPKLEDGRQSLIVVSDNNFNDFQKTQFISLALDLETTPAVTPDIETPGVVNIENSDTGIPGDADDPAIWVNPNNSGESLVIGTLKEGGLVTFNLRGEIQQTIAPENFGDFSYNNVDILYGFQLGNQTVDLVIASDRENDTLAVFKIDPNTQQLTDITAEGILDTIFGVDDGEKTAYGLANYKSPVTGKSYTFVTQADGNQVAQLELKDNGDGTVDAEIVRILNLPVPTGDAEDSQAEGLVVDQELGFLYVAMEEEVGILKFSAEVNGGDDYTVIQPIGRDELVPDIEGLSIYYGDNGTGYLLASSQGDSSYAVFSREGTNEYLGSFVVGDNGDIDQANETDGLDIINVPLGDKYPKGLLVVQDGANDPQKVVEDEEELENASTNFKFIDLQELTKALPTFKLDPTSYDPRNPESRINDGNPDPVVPDPVAPDPVAPDPVAPDPVAPDPVAPDPVVPAITVDDQNVFTVTGTTNLKAQLTANNSSTSNEVGFFIVEDDNGTITDDQGNSLTPSDGDTYLKAALGQSQVLFSTVAENPNDYNPVDISRIIEGVGNGNLVFYLIDNGTTDGVINGSIPTSQVSLGSNFNSNAFTGLITSDLGNDSYSLAWDNNELVFTVSITDESAPIGNNLQGGNSAELIDLTNVSNQVTAEFSVYRDALYNNSVYFYKVDNNDGIIGNINPGASNPQEYLQAAINNIVKDTLTGEIVELSGSNQGITTTQAVIEAGSIIAPMIVVNGNLSQLTDGDASNDPEFYFPYLGSNTDSTDHIRLLADNIFGFEDLPFAGDSDYNDMIVAMNFQV